MGSTAAAAVAVLMVVVDDDGDDADDRIFEEQIAVDGLLVVGFGRSRSRRLLGKRGFPCVGIVMRPYDGTTRECGSYHGESDAVLVVG